jgi:hypothetical protein
MVFHGQDAWRRHPMFNNLWKNPFPGLKYAVIVYGSYLCVEYAYKYITYSKRAVKSLPPHS